MFQKSLLERRCVIPSTGFYEWKQGERKQKYHFFLPESPILFMAGFWNEFQGEKHFVILTTAPNSSIADVHNRMPLVLSKQTIEAWITDLSEATKLLYQTPPELSRAAVS